MARIRNTYNVLMGKLNPTHSLTARRSRSEKLLIIIIIIIYSFIEMKHKMTMYNWRTGHIRLGESS